jgi:hypothetical protein
MRIVSFIDQADVIKKILQHLRLWESHAPPQSEPARKEIKSSPLTHPAASSFKPALTAIEEPMSGPVRKSGRS